MLNVFHIALRELRSTFTTAVGWLVLCAWLLVTGVLWTGSVEQYVQYAQDAVFDPYSAAQLTLTDWLVGPFFQNCSVLLMMVLPAVSMRSFAEDIRHRTLELLLTSPVSTLEIVLGKYLGVLAVLAVLLLGTLHGPLLLYVWAAPDPGVIFSAILGLFLLGGALLAAGLLASALTSNQIVAFLLSFGLALTLLFAWALGGTDPDNLFAQVALNSHLTSLLQGAPKLSDVAYFVAFAFTFLFAAYQRMESFRWN